MKSKTIKQRAAAYGAGKRAAGTHAVGDEGPLAEGWEAGYRSALRDFKQAAMGAADDIERDLSQALLKVVANAAARFNEAMGEMK